MASGALDPRVVGRLEHEGVAFCLIGAAALSANGFARYTADLDLLTLDPRVLDRSFWDGLPLAPELRKGGEDDPLRGVARFEGEVPLDLIVGKGHAPRVAVGTAVPSSTFACRVAPPLALTLLKREAGSPPDRADLLSLVAVQRELGSAAWLAEVPGHVAHLSAAARAAWGDLQVDLERA